jgi:hypothetical protein
MPTVNDLTDTLLRLLEDALLRCVPFGPFHADAFARGFEYTLEAAAETDGDPPAAPAPAVARKTSVDTPAAPARQIVPDAPASKPAVARHAEEKADTEAGVLV